MSSIKKFATYTVVFVIAFASALLLSMAALPAHAISMSELQSEAEEVMPTVVTVTRHKGSNGQWVVTSIEAAHNGASYAAVAWPTSDDPDVGYSEEQAADRIADFCDLYSDEATVRFIETPGADTMPVTADSVRLGGLITIRPRGVVHDKDLEMALDDLCSTIEKTVNALAADEEGIIYPIVNEALTIAFNRLDVREVVVAKIPHDELVKQIKDAEDALSAKLIRARQAATDVQEPVPQINGFDAQMG